jgi:hypothetical protein
MPSVAAPAPKTANPSLLGRQVNENERALHQELEKLVAEIVERNLHSYRDRGLDVSPNSAKALALALEAERTARETVYSQAVVSRGSVPTPPPPRPVSQLDTAFAGVIGRLGMVENRAARLGEKMGPVLAGGSFEPGNTPLPDNAREGPATNSKFGGELNAIECRLLAVAVYLDALTDRLEV